MIDRRKFVHRTASLAGVAAFAGFPAIVRAQSERPIMLGQSAAFSGAAAQLGTQFYQGAKLYFDLQNAQPGARKIEIKFLDDGYEPERCVANTKQLISDDMFALFGYVGTPTSVAALPLIVKEKIPFFAPFTGAMALRDPLHRNVFHLRASYNDETALIVQQLTNLGIHDIAVFYQNDAYGKAGLDGVELALAGQKRKPVVTATVERNSTDVAQAVKTIVAAKPQAIVQISAYTSCAAFIREARKAGYGANFFNVSFVGTQALADALGKEAAGTVVSQVVPSPYARANESARDFADAVRKVGDKVQANFTSMEGFLAAKVFSEGLRRAGAKPSRDSLIAGLESIDRQQFSGFSAGFSPKDHVASHFVELSMIQANGKILT
jgi:branched-chain amino acid transport system substrate-binding protein